MFKAALSKIIHGFFVGLGFAVSLGLLLYGYETWQVKRFEEQTSELREDVGGPLPMFKNYTPDAGLLIKEHRPQERDATSAFVGSIQNTGQDAWQGVELLVELFDRDGTFVDKCTSHLDGSIGPGQTRNFKVSCSECRNTSQPLAYDRYTIAIASAYYVQPEAEPKQ